jgi:hypothetical protein
VTVTVIQPDAAAGKDTFLRSNSPTANSGAATAYYIGDQSTTASIAIRFLLAFPLDAIPAGDVIDDVELTLEDAAAGGTGDPASWAANLRRVLVEWVEGQATWNIRKTGTNWNAGGCSTDGTDRTATPSAFITLDTTAGSFVTWSGAGLVADVQGWLDGDFGNYGWLLSCDDAEFLGTTETAYNYIVTSDHATANRHPKLTITHHTPAGGCPIHLLRPTYYPRGIVL